MANRCVNISHKEFKNLVEGTRKDPFILAADVSIWQDKNNTDVFPKAEELYFTTIINSSVISQGTVNEEIKEKLYQYANQLGITIESLDDYFKRTGQNPIEDINGLADIFNKTIAIKEGADPQIIAEEVSHIIVASTRGTNLYNKAIRRLKERIDKGEFKELYDEYLKEYKNPEKVYEELLGKLLAEYKINKTVEPKTTLFRKTLNELWNWFINLFDKNSALNKYLEEINQVQELKENPFIQEAEIFYNIDVNEDVDLEIEHLEKIIKSQKNRLRELRNRNLKSKTDALKKRIEELEDKLELNENSQGLYKFVKYMQQDGKEALQYISKVKSGKEKINSTKIKHLSDFIAYYEPLIEEMLLAQKENLYTNVPKSKKFIKELEKAEKYFDAIKRFNKVQTENQTLEILRDVLSEKLGIDRTDPELDNKIVETTGWDFTKEVKVVNKDSSFMEYLFGSKKDSSDNLLRVIYSWIADVKQKVHEDSLNWGRDFIEKVRQLGFLNKNVEFAYEKIKDKKGKLKKTGRYIGKYYNHILNEQNKAFHDQMHSMFNFPTLSNQRKIFKRKLNNYLDGNIKLTEDIEAWYRETIENSPPDKKKIRKKLKLYNEQIALYYTKNYIPIDNARKIYSDIIEKHEKGLITNSEFVAWQKKNIVNPNVSPEFIKFKGDLVVPSDGRYVTFKGEKVKTENWKNQAWGSLTSQQKEYVKLIKESKAKINDMLPDNISPDMGVQINQSMLDVLAWRKGGLFKHLKEKIGDLIVERADDQELFGVEGFTRPDGSKQKFLPVLYTKLLENPDSITSDITSAIIAYYEMAVNYKEMATNVNKLEVVLTQTKNRKFKSNKKGILSGEVTNTYNTLDKFLDMNLYGIKKEGGNIEIFGKKIKAGKFLTKFTNYVRANNLALALFTGFSNAVQVASQYNIENITRQYSNPKSAKWALKEFSKRLLKYGNPKTQLSIQKKDKLYNIMQALGIVDPNRMLFKNIDKNGLTRKLDNSLLYGIFQAPEFVVKGNLALSIMHDTRLHKGKFYTSNQFKQLQTSEDFYSLPSIWSLMKMDSNGKIQYNFDQKEFTKLANKIKTVANHMDGKMTELDYAYAHQNVLLSMVTVHRNWIFSGLQKRFKGKNYNYETGVMDEGYYITFGKFMMNTLFHKERLLKVRQMLAKWNELDDYEKQNLKRFISEMVTAWIAMTIAIILNNIAEDEDDYHSDLAAYLANRVLLETAAFGIVPMISHDGRVVAPFIIYEGISAIKDPLVPMRTVEYMFDYQDMLDTEEVKRGQWKGFTKQQRALLRLVPGIKGLSTVRDPNAANRFLKNRPLKNVY